MAWHDKGVYSITLTDAQQDYVRENYNRQSTYEMARNLKIQQSSVWHNMQLMGLKRVHLGREKKPTRLEKKGFFDVDAQSCWL